MALDWFKRLIGTKKLKPGQTTTVVTRNIGDIQIGVTEGIGGTREINVNAWNPEIAEKLFWSIRRGLIGKEE